MKTSIIKTSQHNFFQVNSGKNITIKFFISLYKEAVEFYVDYLFNNEIKWKNQVFSVNHDLLDCPMFISTKDVKFISKLSARALKCASTQACGIVKSAISKRKRLLFIREKLKSEHKRTRDITRKLQKTRIHYPILVNVLPELNSICANIENFKSTKFDSVLILSSLFKKSEKIKKVAIPFSRTKHSDKLLSEGTELASIQLSPSSVYLHFDITKEESKTSGQIVGADQGINTVVTLSNGTSTDQNPDIHGHTLNKILKKISRRKTGSKGFHKALDHRDNFIRASINKLNLENIKEIRLEKISNFRKGKKTSKFLNYFSESLIKSHLMLIARQRGVRVVEQNSAYRSQRCSCCGYVSRSNRHGKLFRCKRCYFQTDADCNASCNHEQNLPSAGWMLKIPKEKRIKEFFWNEKGFFDLLGSELERPDGLAHPVLIAVPKKKGE